jgi:hypothetical protein
MRNNSISSVYLSKCDLLHKLAIKNIHKSPKIEKVSFQFLLKNTKLNVSSNVEMNNQIKGILLLYTFLGLNSSIEYRSEKNVVDNYTQRNTNSYYAQKIELNNSQDIENFLYFLFVENDFKKIAKFTTVTKFVTSSNSLNLNILLPLSIFSDSNEFCSFSAKDIPLKELNIQLSFTIKNTKNLNENNFLVLSPLWHFG